MKINEVEQLVGITKKNIRFYEDCGLINPGRDSGNSYRDYTDQDVVLLTKIRLLRRLGVPIEDIRRIIEGKLSLEECLERHMICISHEEQNLQLVNGICTDMIESGTSFADVDANGLLDRMDTMEKGGARFMNIEKSDVRRKKTGAVIAAAVMMAIVVLYDVAIIVASINDPIPTAAVILITAIPTAVAVGVAIALVQRIKEIDKGEENEASKY